MKDGYLPESLINFILLLGWAPKDNRELFTLEEFVGNFDINGFQEANPKFSIEKLNWFNGYYIRKKSDDELLVLLKPYLPENADFEKVKQIIPLIKDRLIKLSDFSTFAEFFFDYKKPDMKLFGENYKKHLETAFKIIESTEPFDLESLNSKLMVVVKDNNFKTGEFFMDLRIAVAGSKFTPPINESIVILGKEETLKRLREFV